ncbi:MAG: glycerol-3-phosphate dehydrogenase subunit GlpB [Desulfobacterales bacterium]|nr:MAG: glycerol-3-phosphate dehydrogenase subunit GlpB [Desulfobacterales bacterium]
MSDSEILKADVCIIGAGLAGLAATLFAANRGMSCIEVGQTGEINFTTGFLDLLGVHPAGEKHEWTDPWAGIDALVRDIPQHPYARLTREDIHTAFEENLAFLKEAGLPYMRQMNQNSGVLTSLGTLKPTYCVPQTMWNGVVALENKPSCLLIDFQGLKGFSARQIAAALQNEWPDLRTARVGFPDTDHLNEVFTEHMASALILPQNRDKFARTLQPHIKNAQIVGLPAMLGLYRTQEVVSELQKMMGVPLFEIPTIPPSVPGLRLKEAFERGLRTKGVQYLFQKRVLAVRHQTDEYFEIDIGRTTTELTLRSRGVILASGRFIGGGLHADRKRIKETIFDLPVYQPDNRTDWHRRDFLDPRGHLLNQAGVEIDESFRPLNSSGQPAFKNLFAAGSILAHNDWKRIKCGAGVAIASAFGAVKSFMRINK